ncbi:MAG: M23 family metallopeptidase [Candidatus Eisenbacteria bacterium]|uniref:M23 family metallopeptidase n=1 Tax=Eiseniibacteriota bacterium TaxID=2212470 RepID=A0A7Y2EC27_UNCEI|nr:M23 family metallopeptidase [Candidatus Eisenbacteria bacterium]
MLSISQKQRILGVLLLGLLTLAGSAFAKELIPPLEGYPPLTSSFGEYRSGHFHGGLDFSTGGQEGLPVRVPGDGHLFRMRVSGVGYGRALYIRLDDGRTVLYAHLSRFNHALEKLAREQQDRKGRYEIDYRPAQNTVRVSAGEVVAYSGQSGAGPPHLHAEVRVGGGAAIAENPMDHGWAIQDTIPPRLTALRFEPSGPGAEVNAEIDPVNISLPKGEVPVVNVYGPVRLWVETQDRANGGRYRLASYEVIAELNDERMAHIQMRAFDWNHAREVEWIFHERLAREKSGRWVNLSRTPRTKSRMYKETGSSETDFTFPAGSHRLVVRCLDYSGNETRREVRLVVQEEPSAATATVVRERGLRVQGNYLEARYPLPVKEAPSVLDPYGEESTLEWISRETRGGGVVFQTTGAPLTESGVWSFAKGTQKEQAAWVSLQDPNFLAVTDSVRLQIEASDLYEPMWIGISPQGWPGVFEKEPELIPVSQSFRLEPWAYPLRGSISVEIVSDKDLDRVGVYSRHGDRWSYEGNDVSTLGLKTNIGNLEELALFRDVRAPQVSLILPKAPKADSTPRVKAKIVDTGSGVTWRTMDMEVNGQSVICEWDPDARVLQSHLRTPLASGEHSVRVSVRDRAGNRTVREASFQIP